MGLRPGSRGHSLRFGPHPGRSLPGLRPSAQVVVRAWPPGLVPRLFRGPFCPLRVRRLRRGPCPCARPLRGGPPAAASRGRSGVFARRCAPPAPPPGACPPAPPLGLVRACALRRRSLAPLRLARHPLRCGLPPLPLLRSGAPGRFALPRRVPLAPSGLRFAPSGFGGGWLRPGGLGGAGAAFSGLGPRGFLLRARACPRFACPAVGFSLAPPRPAAPAGGSGVRVACPGKGPAGPRLGAAFRSPSRRPPRGSALQLRSFRLV